MRTLSLRPEQLRTRDGEDGSLELDGIAVPWDDPIEYGGITERFQRGAITPDDAIGRPLLWAHDRAEPIGHIVAANDTPVGLTVTAVVQPTARGRDAITLLRGGSLRGLSVGFQPVDQKNTPTGITYTRAALAELSVTPLPAYAAAAVTATREEETPVAEGTVETREVDLAPITERLDQLEARMAERRTERPRTLGVVEAFTRQLQDFTERREMRALADVVSSGNAGILPPAWSSEVRGYTDAMRYMIPRAGSAAFPASGTGLTVPKILQDTTVGPRGTEKTEPPSQALTTGSDTFAIEWFAGAVDLAMELVEQSNPSALQLVVTNLLQQYAAATDLRATAAAEAAATASGAPLDTTDYGTLVGDLIDTGETIRAATGVFGNLVSLTTASWKAVAGMTDADGRRVLATRGSTNADGSAPLDASTVDVGGVLAFHNPRATVDVQFNATSYRVAEKSPEGLRQTNVGLLGIDVGVLGAIIPLPMYPAGIVKYAVAA